MTRKLQSGLVFILLLIAISCTKENDNSPFSTSASSQTATSSSADEAIAPPPARFNFGGIWVLHWSWSCGAKSNVSINFKSNGTFSDGFGETGVWTAGPHSILFKFNGRTDHWTGHDIAGGSVDGIMADFSVDNSHGCITMTRSASSSITEIIKGTTSRSGQ